eukprot:CAMPEP_0206215590 /NCGR_PEP_ID=MMETSP0047_2-20121206/2276_1 /ASSEMBLY_ACC=CAM_ASM_000192 /TAXON_ID=195065 /ORGANISM="Chroomonas mesostigmatica_cf, Strain CCMP1168" /LENGTH=558 /DNA_ID=CAMNT_0053637895 /DNA_START=335 /DNA_END=2011 /DNA_ORIENTATION=+
MPDSTDVRACGARSLLLVLGFSLAVLPPEAAAPFAPKWGSSGGGGDPPRVNAAANTGEDTQTCSGESCKAHHATAIPLPPPFSARLQIMGSTTSTASPSEIDPQATSLYAAPGAAYRHGIPLGLTVMTRKSNGQIAYAAGHAHTGSIFNMHNGTYFLYSTVFYSPALARTGHAEISVRIGERHITGSPLRIPMDYSAIAQDYEARVDAARAAGRQENFDKEGACGGDFVIVSGSSSGMFDRLVNLIGSVHVWAPTTPCIVYDLGMSPAQAEDVKTWDNVEYRRFDYSKYPPHVARMGENGTYAWRGPILVGVTEEHQCVLWLDAGLELRSDIGVIRGHIAHDGHFHVTNGWPSPNKFTHTQTVQHLGLSLDSFYAEDSRIEIESCGGIQGYRRGSVMQRTVLQRYNKCLLEQACSAPEGASKANFRQDQTVLNVVLAEYRQGLALDSPEYFLSLPHTARKYWEHPEPKHTFPVRDDGTFRPCDKGTTFRDGGCVPCISSDEAMYIDMQEGVLVCEDDEEIFLELPGAAYVPDLVIFIRRAFQPRPYEDSLRYSLVGTI